MDSTPPDRGWFDLEVIPPRAVQPQQLFVRPPPEARRDPPPVDRGVEASSSSSSALQDYVESLVGRVEGRSAVPGARPVPGGGPLTQGELAELALLANQEKSAWREVSVDALTAVAQWLYEHVLKGTSVSLLEDAGRSFQEGAAPSAAVAALNQVRAAHRTRRFWMRGKQR
jgi:hypothetical protein